MKVKFYSSVSNKALAVLMVVVLAMAALPVTPVYAAVTAELVPTANGTYNTWAGGFANVDEGSAAPSPCADYINTAGAGNRETYVIPLTSVPDGSTITSIDVYVAYSSASATIPGTFSTMIRFNGVDSVFPSSHTASGTSTNCTGFATDTFDVTDTVKNGTTTLEIGVEKNDPNGVRVGTLSAYITYFEAPIITSVLPPAGKVGVAYSHTFTATGIPVPTFSLTGTLPAGLTFDGVDTISGTPTNSGSFTGLSVTAANGFAPDDTQNFSITIDPRETTLARLPVTGFPQGKTTTLSPQPVDQAYTSYTDLWLEIPKLDVKMDIVGVPQTSDSWNVSWLDQKAGWLNGSAFPTWDGNSVITGHVWDALNRPGPFSNLRSLKYGDQIMIHSFGQVYTYEIRESKIVLPTNISTVFEHEVISWITLITCEDYKEQSLMYSSRRMVRAVLVSVKAE